MLSNILDIWTDLEAVPSKNNSTVVVQGYATVHPDDHEPVSIINPDLENGPWIAGGAVLQWYQGLPVMQSDIDIFCKTEEQIEHIIAKFRNLDAGKKWSSENAETLQYVNKGGKCWTVQIIKRKTFKDLQSVIDNFDISVCQVGTAGNEYLMGKHTAVDIKNKKLRMKLPLQSDAAKRYTKYVCYGYLPDPSLCKDIVENSDARWSYTMQDDYNNAF